MVKAILIPPRHAASSRAQRALSFDGIRRQDLCARPEAARKLGAILAERGEIAYWVSVPDGGGKQGGRPDKRASAREKTRLRSAKLLDAAYRFVCECRICDRSIRGIRLLLARNIKVRRRMAVHIDETGEVRGARVVWRKGSVIGVSLRERAPPGAIRPADRYALRERYYGILD